MIGETKNYCLECIIHLTGQSKNQKRCVECPDRKDYLLRIEGREPFHRGFAPDKLGFEPFDPLNHLNEQGQDKEQDQDNDKAIIKECIVCKKHYPVSNISKYFSKNVRSADGYLKTCKKCMGKKISESHKMRKKIRKENNHKQQIIEPSNKVPTKSQPESTVEANTKNTTTRICKKCGKIYTDEEIEKNFSFHNSTIDGLYKICKKCMTNKISKTMKDIQKEKKLEINVKLNFTDYPEMLEEISKLAKKDFRSVEQEILAIIDIFLEENKSERIG